MAWNNDIDLSTRKYSSRLIVERAIARGWKIRGFETNAAIFLIYISGREKPIKIFSASPPQMSYPAVKIAKDKYITNQILSENGLPVPDEMLVKAERTGQELIDAFLHKHGKIVVKPLDASHGLGVTVGVNSIKRLNEAIEYSLKHTDKSHILLQEQIDGHDIRVVCIDYRFSDAITRVPASVTGNGTSTIRELIDTVNQNPERGENYHAKLNRIPAQESSNFLGKEQMKRVPAAGELVRVIGISNTGMGGERLNLKDNLPVFLKEMAEKVAKVLELPVCGVDFFVSKLPSKNSQKEELNPFIIEVNECPSLVMYEDIRSPEQLKLVDIYLDYLAS